MAEFLYWGQVQQRLTDRMDKTGSAFSFFDAVRELWSEGAATQAEAPPRVSFEQWDGADAGEFDWLYSGVPVPLDLFYGDFRKNLSAAKSFEPIITTEVIPLRIASDQAIGLHRHDFFEIDYVMSGRASLETNGQRRPGGRESQQTRLMLSVLQYVQAHYRDTSPGETAEHFGYEASYLGKQIKAATGKNYTDIVRELRIGEAKRLLCTTTLTMDEVADAVGYESRVQFFRSFRAGTGMTPGEYRKSKTSA